MTKAILISFPSHPILLKLSLGHCYSSNSYHPNSVISQSKALTAIMALKVSQMRLY